MNKKLILITFSILFIVSCGGGGGGGSTPTTPDPTVNLSADPTSVLLESTSTLTWSSTNATSCSASWTTQTGTSGSEAVTITTAGSNSFSISCTGDGGSRSASTTVEGYRNTDGVVVDGYISGAEVFIDEDDDWVLDSNENSTTSDNEGKFTIRYANGNLVSIGGTDLDSQTLLDNLLITHKLTGHSDFKAVTPVTSIAAFMEDASLVNAALGIDTSIDVFTFDPVANKGDGGINDYLYEKGNQLTVLAFALQNITNNLNTTTETTQDYFKAITEEIEKEYTETETRVDIETEAFVTKALDNVIAAKSVTIDQTAKANVTKALSGMLPIIQVKSSDDLTTGVIRFAVSTLQTDIQAIANGTATAEIVTSYTEDLLTYIAEDQNIDADEIAPDISAIADSATTSEDTAVEINVLLNDSYVTSSPFSLLATNGANGSTSISNNLITYSPDTDYNGSDSFSYTITQGDKTSSADVTITIEAVNDAPSIDIASTIQVAENQTAVTTVSVSDVDEDELTLTLGGTDADSFNLSDENVLTFKEAPDYETKDSYSITLTLTDGTETVAKDITIAIIDINDAAPVFTSDATFSAAENQTAIGTVTATDPEGDSFSFSISGSELTITPAGVLSFTSAPDYETKASYTATVTVVDTEDNSATQDINVNVTNVNDNSPVFTSNTTFSSDENQTAIGTVTATDADGDALTFTVSGSELAITPAGVLTFVSAPDYETKATYTATVTASDGTNSTTQDITVNVNNVNDVAPEFTSEATFSAAENQTAIGTVTATDAEGDEVTFTISGDELAITPAGVLTFVSAPDYETKTTYTATLTASDGTNSATQDITINVTNVNDNSPVITSSNEYSIEENTTEVGQATATDADGDGLVFSITSDSDISIDSSSGVIYFNRAPDYETTTSHSATITVSDGAFTSSQEITINVTDADEGPPELIDLEINGFGSNSDTDFKYSSTQIQFTVTDETAISKIVLRLENTDTKSFYENIQDYTLTDGGNSEGRLEDTWSIAFKNKLRSGTYKITELGLYDTLDKSVNAVIDTNFDTSFEVTNSNQEIVAPELLAHTVTINDNVLTVHALIKEEDSKIAKYRHRGIDANASSSEIDEASYYINVHASDTSVGYVGDIVDSSDLIDNEDGTFNVVTRHDMSSNADAEAAEIILYEIHDTAFNRTEYLQNSSLKPVPDPNANPIFISDSTFSVDENETGIGTASARNAKGDALTYSVSGSEVIINETSGVMVFASAPDYESKSTYTVTVTATDGTNSSTQEITININDVREQTIQVSVEANNNGSGNVYVINGTQRPNLDLVKGVTYTFVHPTAHPFRFSTTADGTHGGGAEYSTGVNTGSSGTTIIKVTDNTPEGLYYYCSIHSGMGNGINLIDNASPEFTSSAIFSADENQTAIGTVTATDAEGDAITYSISGSDIEITSAGVLSFVAAPDYETKSSYSATITANDGTSSSTQDITVNINNLNDNSPSFTSNATFSADENQTAIGTVTATDADGDDVTFTVSGDELTITSAGVLTFVSTPDYETKATYTATVTASDGTNSTTQDITVNVTNINDVAPEFTSDATFNADENQTAIGTVTATDVEGDDVTFTISGSELEITSAGVLTFVSAPDYETKTSYSATVTASDGANSTNQEIILNVNNLNDNPLVITSSDTFSIEENKTPNEGSDLIFVGNVIVEDADGFYGTTSSDSSPLSFYHETNSVDREYIHFSGGSSTDYKGVLSLLSSPDYESKSSYSVRIGISNGGDGDLNTVTQDITINVTNINDNSPVFTSDASFSAAENQTAIGTVIATDADSDTITYSISGTDSESISINSSSGTLTFNSAPDYETKTSYTATVTASDGTNSTTQDITVDVTNVNDNSPSFTSNATFSADENQTAIGTVTATDADGDDVTFTVSGDELTITSAGVLTFVSTPDYETKATYTATVTASDGTNSTTQDITVNVTNINDNSPVFTSNATFSAEENQTAIGTVVASDADGDGIAYSISDSDITIDASSGVIAFVSAPDYETTTSYSATVTASDGSNSNTQDITVNITDVLDTFDIGGTVYASRYMVLDSDVPNTSNNPSSGNEFGSAQVVTNPVTIIGHTGDDVDTDGNSTSDQYDLYQISLTNNMYARLEVVEYEADVNDLDLYLYNTDGTLRDWEYAAGSTEDNETIDLPDSGTILLQVNPVNGSSRYILKVGQRISSSNYEKPEFKEHAYVTNQFIQYNIFGISKEKDLNKEFIKDPKIKNIEVDRAPSENLENLSILKFDMSAARRIYNIDEINSKDKNLEISSSQKEYLYHTKLQRKLSKNSLNIGFDFDYYSTTFEAFSKDPYYSYQWNFDAINAQIGINQVGQETKDIVVAVLDTGSPTLNSSAWNATNFISGGADYVGLDYDPTDPDSSSNLIDSQSGKIVTSHGTHVASTIGAKNDGNDINGFGIKVLPIRVIPGTLGATIAGIEYASGLSSDDMLYDSTEGPVKVINMSLGFMGLNSCPQSLQNAIDNAVNQGITVVAAAGNFALESPGETRFPAGCDNVISVGALDESGINRSSFSDYNSSVDVTAPGGGHNPGLPAWDKDSRVEYMSGTSMAAPMVSGVIASLYAYDSTLTNDEINTYLAAGSLTNDLGEAGRDDYYGNGGIDFAKSLASISSQKGLDFTFAYSTPAVIDFGYNETSIDVVLNKQGTSSLSVSSLLADNTTGLSYTSDVDSEGFGTYTIQFDRTDLPNGEFTNTIYFEMSNSTLPALTMNYAKGAEPSRANLGKVYIQLYDSSNEVVAAGLLELDGSLAFSTTNPLPIGDYYYIISTDIDNDGYICTTGEICEIYPTSDSIDEYISLVDKDITGDAVTLRAISSLSSSLSINSNIQTNTNEGYKLEYLNNIIAKQKPLEINPKKIIPGKPFIQKK